MLLQTMEGGSFLNLIESIDKFAVGIFRQFLIREEADKVLILTPNEEYKSGLPPTLATALRVLAKA